MNKRITISPDVRNGRTVVRGTLIAVQTVLEFLAVGDSVDNVLAEYPALTRNDMKAPTPLILSNSMIRPTESSFISVNPPPLPAGSARRHRG